jgi:hypothetical protein
MGFCYFSFLEVYTDYGVVAKPDLIIPKLLEESPAIDNYFVLLSDT